MFERFAREIYLWWQAEIAWWMNRTGVIIDGRPQMVNTSETEKRAKRPSNRILTPEHLYFEWLTTDSILFVIFDSKNDRDNCRRVRIGRVCADNDRVYSRINSPICHVLLHRTCLLTCIFGWPIVTSNSDPCTQCWLNHLAFLQYPEETWLCAQVMRIREKLLSDRSECRERSLHTICDCPVGLTWLFHGQKTLLSHPQYHATNL